MGRPSLVAITLFMSVSLVVAGCGSGDDGPKTKEELTKQLSKTVDYSKLSDKQKAALPNPGDGTHSAPPK